MEIVDLIKKHSTPLSPIATSQQQTGSINNRISAVIFDIYGTLLISGCGDISIGQNLTTKNRPLDKLLDKYGINKKPDEIRKQLAGAIAHQHTRLHQKGIDYPEVVIENIWKTIIDLNESELLNFVLEYELIMNPVWPMPHVEEVIKHCRNKNILLGIVSNAQFYTPVYFSAFFNKNLTELGFKKDLIFFSNNYHHAKPSTFLFLEVEKALAEKDISSVNCLYIGNDIRNDIYPAQKTGFQTALFAGDKRSLRLREDDALCKNCTPDIIITDLIQLTGILN